MTQSSQAAVEKGFVLTETGAIRAGEERAYPLNKLKRSPENVRKGGHSEAVIEQRAASILAKGLIHLPVVKPERRPDGSETGYALVTAGEGRRLALRLLAKRKLIPKTALIRCLVDEANDAVEVSLDENISRNPLHPADEFEAFFDLSERQGRGAEEIAARFGVTAAVVRQRLRLAAAAPDLITRYREEALTLDQLMAFTVCEDHDRQRQVFEAYPHAHPSAIRRAMTEKTVQADDRRVRFVGVEAYVAAGGVLIRDLFTEDRGGYLSNVALLDQLVGAKLADMAAGLKADEGWKWVETHLDYPHGHGLARVWPKPVEPSPERLARCAEHQALNEAWGEVEDLPPEVAARLTTLDAELADDVTEAYDPADLARAGVWVVLGYDGQPRIERGLVRPEDEVVEPEPEGDGEADEGEADMGAEQVPAPSDAEEADGDPRAPLSAKLVAELTAHRTAGLRLALSNDPDLALVALTHVLVLGTFHGVGRASCLDIQVDSTFLPEHGEGVKTSPAHEAMQTRHGQWAKQIPEDPEAVWDFVVGLDHDSRASLLAFCVANSLDAVRAFGGRGQALAHADVLATVTGLDMTAFWSATEDRYLARVTKAHVLAAVDEAVSPDTAQRLSGLKKAELIAAAQPDLVKARWLPWLLRTRPAVTASADEEGGPSDDPSVEAEVEGDAQDGAVTMLVAAE
ncbi:ParB/RepB/Spo0J family partition protein [Caulobacter sp. UNC358MFTsu5.1]|uniref:ParB/RepB/Spo0J family partition protein n=1 Tax=Caulobacter sp. UNC358MFTsu5.1 TaxID=1449049 RepID=UPI000ACF0C97|nr:ParB/RepB/Spo0J family partition protein [Caulobacter sp. UNC358MFTsu5.1]